MNRKKILVPLATLLAAGALAAGSGATFTSTSSNTISTVSSGTLTQSNSKANAHIFNLGNIKPGDTVNGSVVITNTGSLPATFTLTETSSTTGFSASGGVNYLSLSIKDNGGATVYSGDFGGLVDGTATSLGQWAAGEARTYTFSVTLDPSAPNTEQGKSATAAYQWDATQLTTPTVTNQ